ncbi:MAG TPA: flagellar biosynthesis protein FlgL [Bradyrhizobium sp.]
MAINSIGSSTSLLGQSVLNIKNQLNTLQVQLATGEKSTTYSGMGTGEGFAIAARAQLSNITGYQSTITNVGTTISAANTALQALSSTSSNVETAANSGSQTLNSNGQTAGQVTAISQLSSMLSILNTQGGNGYIFSGAATNTPSVATADAILNGNGAQAGLTQIISERQQADLGTTGLGRLTVSAPTTTSVSLAQDSSPFGIKLGAVSSTLTGATVTGPAGSPAAISVDLGATNPNPGDQLNITLNMPDGTTQSIKLTATTTSPPPTGSFTIGATSAATAANLQTALTTSITTVANTSLVAASAMEASSNFFDQPPQRVSGPPFNTATSLVNGTSANTVSWYTGGTTTGSARATQVAQIGPSQTVDYGIQANEQGIASQLQAIAAFAAFTVSPTNTNAAAQVSDMSASVAQALSTQPTQQSIQDIQTDLANAQTTMSTASSLQTQTQSTLQDMVSQIETVSPDQVASQILALQTSLQASYQTTSMLSQLSLVKFLPIPSA